MKKLILILTVITVVFSGCKKKTEIVEEFKTLEELLSSKTWGVQNATFCWDSDYTMQTCFREDIIQFSVDSTGIVTYNHYSECPCDNLLSEEQFEWKYDITDNELYFYMGRFEVKEFSDKIIVLGRYIFLGSHYDYNQQVLYSK